MKEITFFFIRLVLTWVFAYLWVFAGSDGALNVLRFYLIGMSIVSFIAVFGSVKPSAERLAQKPTPRVLVWLDVLSEVVLTMLFAWMGLFGMAFAVLVIMLCATVIRGLIRAARAKAAAPSATAAA